MNYIIDCDCFNCGENISISICLSTGHEDMIVEYAYCSVCQWGVEVVSQAETISIIRLEPRQEK